MTTTSAAALTDEEYDAMPWPYGKDEKDWTPAIIEWVESILAARLADGRPVVSEAAIEAAVKVLRHLYGDHAVMPYYEARQIFTAALPHMGDGKGEA